MKRTRLKVTNPKRRKRMRERNFTGGIDHDTWIRARECLLCRWARTRQKTPTQAAHAKARGMGGAGGDWRSLVPLCNDHHRVQEQEGNATVLRVTGICLVTTAAKLAEQHEAELRAVEEEAHAVTLHTVEDES